MNGWEPIHSNLFALAAMALSFVAAGAVIAAAHWFLLGRRKNLEQTQLLPRQIALLVIMVFCTAGVILVLPVSESARNQLIGLLGILLSGMIAFSSTTAMSNLIAGLLMRITRPFRIGDFIRVGEYFGRVTEQGLFDTEVQSEQRELIAIPNIYLMRNPIVATHSAGAIISASLSLGYDLGHLHIESLLGEAAVQSGLKDPFVHITELGDFSVTYRVSGVLEEVKGMITAKSRLHAAILDTLHGANIEIMSPAYMNQRRLADEQKIIPPAEAVEAPPAQTAVPEAENIIFDKAEEAQRLETEKQDLQKRIGTLEQAAKSAGAEDKKQLKEQIAAVNDRLNNLQKPPPAEENQA